MHGDFAGKDYRVALDHCFAGYAAVFIPAEAGVQDGVADLVCVFVRVVLADLFGAE